MTHNVELTLEHVLDHLGWNGRVDTSHIHVKIRDGQVSLLGMVPDFSAREAAEKDVLSIPGVISVNNNLLVISYAESAAPSDEEIQSHIQNLLRWHTDIDESCVDVTVFDRCVTVKGTVDSIWRKTRIGDVVRNIFGVIDVNNALVVVPTKDISDQQITDNIVSAFRRNRFIPNDSVSVTVENGRVILSGKVPDMISYQSTRECALISPGVRAVVHPALIIIKQKSV